MSIKVTPTGAALGAEISGVDLTSEIDDDTFNRIRQIFYRHEVIFFRDCELSDDDHIRFSAGIGQLRTLKQRRTQHLQRPELITISNIIEQGKHIGSYDSGLFWHTDGAYVPHPHAASLLRAVEVPQANGRTLGDTRFSSMTAAYDALATPMKKRLEGLEALNSRLHRDERSKQLNGRKREELTEEEKKNAEAVHPVVRAHPATGRKCLYVSEGYTVRILGFPEDESQDLLSELTAHCVQPRFLYTHNWRVHDLVMWDDCSTQHKATFDYVLPLRRLMYRTTLTNFLPVRDVPRAESTNSA